MMKILGNFILFIVMIHFPFSWKVLSGTWFHVLFIRLNKKRFEYPLSVFLLVHKKLFLRWSKILETVVLG